MTARRTVAVVTGSRAEYGLLRPVMHAIRAHDQLDLRVVVTGTHLLRPQRTLDEVAQEFQLDAVIPMQRDWSTGRMADAAALGRGVSGVTAWLGNRSGRGGVDVVAVLGDRIEAFAAAAAAAVGGVRVAHLHGGDRAPGIADEGLRHAITKLAHIHLPATETSAGRIRDMGEDPARIHVVGSPAIDGLDEVPPLDDAAYEALGRPEIVFLLHPSGDGPEREQARAEGLLGLCRQAGRVLAMHPNHDPGREGILAAINVSAAPAREHLPRREFIGLLRRARVLVGNSSAGLIECAALGVACANVGPRQDGRERPVNVIDAPLRDAADDAQVEAAIAHGLARSADPVDHPYGDGRDGGAGARAAGVLAGFDPRQHSLAKRNTY
ncbi:MAG: UDP-N-acetylglucosamine 2-epimerase [Planctomycetota bacterium]